MYEQNIVDKLNLLKDYSQLLAIAMTIFLAFVGYIFTYFNNLRIAKRKDKLDYINRQLNEFYGPLYVLIESGEIAFKALQKLTVDMGGNRLSFDAPKHKNCISQWEIWLKNVFVPNNILLEKIIVEKSYLIIEKEMPECLKIFIVHNAGYKVLLKNWELENYGNSTSIIDFPREIKDYAISSYKILKEKQAKLIGKTS